MDTSSDEDEDEEDKEVNETTEKTAAPCQEMDKQEVKEEQHKTEQGGQNEKKISVPEKVENKTPSQPAIFIPVDRSPEIQVCENFRCSVQTGVFFMRLLISVF